MKKVILLTLAIITLTGCSKPDCYSIQSWDECEETRGCVAVDFFHPEGYDGPIWACESEED